VTGFEAYYAARLPGPRPAGTGLLVTGDGSALTVLPAALRPATAKAAKARAAAAGGWPDDPADLRKSTKRSAELVCVADIPPRPRTRDDILTALFGTAPGPGPAAPQPAVMIPPPASRLPGTVSGPRGKPCSPRPESRSRRSSAKGSPRPAAGSSYGKGDPAARSWVREQAAKILDGKARDVKSGIRRRATWAGYSTAERAGADACAGYLENKMDYLDYPAFLAAGWPVASGLIEGAARWLPDT
jgi:hypothetical protein